ncbi:MAG: 3-dehydroquinate synthase [Candidatus Curtissbacteria bacterium GW2011_GWC2_41_21]|nr:MAG: 3-dehydroquinate synthase [Candidatus Curtissbacteria bacterium GW2011_GWC2_41_21]
MSKVIVTRPNHDLTTNYLFFWTQTALDLTQTVDLKGTRANKQVFTSVVNKIKPTFILINGHGNSNSVFGHDDSVLIEVGSNEAILKGAITYSRSCKSAEILGQKAIESGCKAFIGLCNLYGNSRPEEGGEHFFTYLMENKLNGFLHGEMVSSRFDWRSDNPNDLFLFSCANICLLQRKSLPMDNSCLI